MNRYLDRVGLPERSPLLREGLEADITLEEPKVALGKMNRERHQVATAFLWSSTRHMRRSWRNHCLKYFKRRGMGFFPPPSGRE